MKLDRRLFVFGGLGAALLLGAGSTPTPEQILSIIDKNLTFESRMARVKMTVTKPGRTKVYEMISYGRGVDEAATEYVAPARDAGTKMLKIKDDLWIYMPSVEKVQKLSGHMLRQGMMGSDISYEDMMESSSWQKDYTAKVVGEEQVEGRACWKVEMNAKTQEVAYAKRVTLVDKELGLPLRQELYALSGMLLKTWSMHDPKLFGERWYPSRMRIEDKLQEGTWTELEFLELQFSVPLEAEIFTMRWLER